MNLTGKTALVTGATGTAGNRIASRLADEGMKVKALVRRPGPVEGLERVELVRGDITDAQSLVEAVQGVHVVVHAAAYIEKSAHPDEWDQARAVNVDGTRHLAEAALTTGVERFVHLSTQAVYDPRDLSIIDESAPIWTEVNNAYAQTKADAERVLWRVADEGLAVTILRPGAILGLHPASIWGPLMLKWIGEGNSMGYHPQDLMGWTHVENLADMTALVLQAPTAAGEHYNAIDGVFQMDEYMGPIAAWLGVEYPEVPNREPNRRERLSEKIKTLGHQTRISFSDAMAELERYVRESRKNRKDGGRGSFPRPPSTGEAD